jgi:hypothetical protein
MRNPCFLPVRFLSADADQPYTHAADLPSLVSTHEPARYRIVVLALRAHRCRILSSGLSIEYWDLGYIQPEVSENWASRPLCHTISTEPGD